MKSFIKQALAHPALGRIAATWSPNALITLAYHRVRVRGQASPLAESLFGPDTETFDRQIAWLAGNTSPLSERDLIDCLQRRRPFPPRATLVTFDDGYRDNFTVAAPILKRHKVPAIYFIAIAALRREIFWWDELAWMLKETRVERANVFGSALDLSRDGRDRLLNLLTEPFRRMDASKRKALMQELRRELKVESVPQEITESTFMTPDEVRSLPEYGISVGCHTVSHPCLARLSPEEQEEELRQSKTELESLTGRACVTVSYPFGRAEHFNADTEDIARKLGFAAGFSLIRGVDRLDSLDPWALCRFLPPDDFDSFPLWLTYPRLMDFRQARSERAAKPIDSVALFGWEAASPAVQQTQGRSYASW